VDFSAWFSPAVVPTPQDFGTGDFPAVTYSFKATSDAAQATSAAPVTYSDSLNVKFVNDDGSPVANTALIIQSKWGTKSGTTDGQGQFQTDHLPPGGVRVVVNGDVLTASDAG
jgi:hypothetical protein